MTIGLWDYYPVAWSRVPIRRRESRLPRQRPSAHHPRMQRRQFLGTVALGSAGLAVAHAGCGPAATPDSPTGTAPAPAGTATGNEPFELHEATIDGLQEAMRSGRLTARAITERYLARIEALNLQGPQLRALIDLNPDALAIADQLDAERKAGKVARPAARHSDRAEGQPRHPRPDDDHGRLAGPRGVGAAAGFVRGAAAARRRRGAARPRPT